jgi:hypothetical protein
MLLVILVQHPRVVADAPDRQPRTTSFLLRYPDLATKDAKVREKIASTRTYVIDQYSESLKEDPREQPKLELSWFSVKWRRGVLR